MEPPVYSVMGEIRLEVVTNLMLKKGNALVIDFEKYDIGKDYRCEVRVGEEISWKVRECVFREGKLRVMVGGRVGRMRAV